MCRPPLKTGAATIRRPRTDYRFVRPAAQRTLPMLFTTVPDRSQRPLFSCGHATYRPSNITLADGRTAQLVIPQDKPVMSVRCICSTIRHASRAAQKTRTGKRWSARLPSCNGDLRRNSQTGGHGRRKC